MARSLVSDFFIKEVAERFFFSVFTDKLILLQMALGGMRGSPISVVPPGELSSHGERLVIPFFKRISSLVTRRDLTSSSAPSDLKLDGDTRGMVVIRRKVGPIAWSTDIFKTSHFDPVQFSAELGKQAGEEAFKEIQDRIFDVIISSLSITIATVSHVKDFFEPFNATLSTNLVNNNTLSLGVLNEARQVLGDSMMELSSMVLRSEIGADLVEANLARDVDVIGGYSAVTGMSRTLGMGNPIMIDATALQTADPSGSRQGSGTGSVAPDIALSGTSHTLFRTLLLGEGMARLTFPHNLEMMTEGPKLDAEAPYFRMLGTYDFAVHVNGIGYKAGSAANPTNAQLQDSTNFEDKTTGGSREVLGVIVETNRRANAN